MALYTQVQTLPDNYNGYSMQHQQISFRLCSSVLCFWSAAVYKANICRALLLWGSLSWWVMADAAITQSGLTTGPDNHLLEVRLTFRSDRSLSSALYSLRGSFAVVLISVFQLLFHSTQHIQTKYRLIFFLILLDSIPQLYSFCLIAVLVSGFPMFPLHPSCLLSSPT